MKDQALDDERRAPVASPLIAAQELMSKTAQPKVKLFDVRGTWGAPAAHDAYLEGHIPGAVFLDWTREFVEPHEDISLASVADAEGAQRSFRELGIDPGDQVVLYDDNFHLMAGRMWWAMRYWGFTDVRVLDGGWSHWNAQGLPTETAARESLREGTFQVSDPVDSLRIGLDEFIVRKDSACLFDARGKAGYAGTPDDPRSGHIPRAISVPYLEVVDPQTGRFRDAAGIEAVLDAATPEWREGRVISSCGAGYAGSVLLLALHIVGKSASLFDGSFSVWKQDPSREVSRVS